jgi:ribokinase
MEVPMETNIAAAKVAHRAGIPVALNPAPAPEDGKLPEELLRHLTFIIPNQTEVQQLTGIEATTRGGATQAAAALRALGPKTVILTLGEQGALLSQPGTDVTFVDSFSVCAIDTTAAGDAFCGAFAASFARGTALDAAIKFGCAAGALACTRLGAEPSLPQLQEIEQLLTGGKTANIV